MNPYKSVFEEAHHYEIKKKVSYIFVKSLELEIDKQLRASHKNRKVDPQVFIDFKDLKRIPFKSEEFPLNHDQMIFLEREIRSKYEKAGWYKVVVTVKSSSIFIQFLHQEKEEIEKPERETRVEQEKPLEPEEIPTPEESLEDEGGEEKDNIIQFKPKKPQATFTIKKNGKVIGDFTIENCPDEYLDLVQEASISGSAIEKDKNNDLITVLENQSEED